MMGFSGPSFEEFVQRAPGPSRPLLQLLREWVRRQYPDAVEEVRFHRVVYGRKTVWRRFLDMRPLPDGVELDVRVGLNVGDTSELGITREGGWTSLTVKAPAKLAELTEWLDRAYRSV
jgi:hypothetical protein